MHHYTALTGIGMSRDQNHRMSRQRWMGTRGCLRAPAAMLSRLLYSQVKQRSQFLLDFSFLF